MSATSDTSGKKVLTMAEVQQLAADKAKCILVIDNHVFDVTKFIDEHPGGEQVLKEQHGKDASHAFEDVGHSTDAREQLKGYEIAVLHSNDVTGKPKSKPVIINPNANAVEDNNSSWTKWIIPLVIAVAAAVLFKLLSKSGTDINRPPTAI